MRKLLLALTALSFVAPALAGQAEDHDLIVLLGGNLLAQCQAQIAVDERYEAGEFGGLQDRLALLPDRVKERLPSERAFCATLQHKLKAAIGPVNASAR